VLHHLPLTQRRGEARRQRAHGAVAAALEAGEAAARHDLRARNANAQSAVNGCNGCLQTQLIV
jgi:hypothetical protein